MRAHLAVGGVRINACPHEYAWAVRPWIREGGGGADRNPVGVSDRACRIRRLLVQPGAEQYPGITHKHTETRQRQEFRQLAPAHVAFIGGEYRELVMPKRLAIASAEPAYLSPPTCSPPHQSK